MKTKNKFSLKEQYLKSWDYIRECKNYIFWVIGVFVVFSILGGFFPVPEEISSQILEFIEELLEMTKDMSGSELAVFIFLNNLKSAFFSMIGGIIFGIFPIMASLGNGYLLGFVGRMAVAEAGVFSLWRLLPHGIFELTAVFIAMGMGVKFGTFIFQKNKLSSFGKFLLESLRVFFFVVLPLLIVAAIIEGFLIALS